jgi:hypothetical protein
VVNAATNEINKILTGKKDSTNTNPVDDTKKKLEDAGKGLLKDFNPFKKKN